MKDLNLRREKIIDSIVKFANLRFLNWKISPEFKKLGGTRNRVDIIAEEKAFYMDFHFLTKGSTSIDLSGGSEKELRVEIADFVINDEECLIVDVDSKNKWFVASGIEHNDIKAIIEMLQESDCCDKSFFECQGESLWRLKGIYQEKLTITYYPSTKKVLLQGRPLLLLAEAMILITTLVDTDEIPTIFNDYYNVQINKEDIMEQYKIRMPNSHSKHTSNLQKVLLQAVYNYNLEGEMFDYGYLAFPALKALEGHLKTVISRDNSISLNNRFDIFNNKGNYWELKPDYKAQIASEKTIEHIEKGYTFFHNRRHSLFHWDDPTQPVDTTTMISNIQIAKGLIIDTLNIIDSYYVA